MAGLGGLYTREQPHVITPTWIGMMERDRADRKQRQANQLEKMAQKRAKMFDNLKDVDAEGKFKEASVRASYEVREHMVDLYNNYSSGNMSETEYLLQKSKLDALPDKLTGVYQMHQQKSAELAKGDEVLNFDNINALGKAEGTLDIKYNKEKGDFDISFEDVNGDTQTLSPSAYGEQLSTIRSEKAQGDPWKVAQEFGNDFKSDLIQNGRYTESGIQTGESLDRFDTAFNGAFGPKDAGDNPLVRKGIIQGDDSRDTYEESWESLRAQALSQVSSVKRRSPEPQPKAAADPNKKLKSMNWNKFSDEITDTSDNKIKGGAYTFAASDAAQKVDFDLSVIDGMPQDVAQSVKVNEVFLADNGDVYVKGTANLEDAKASMFAALRANAEGEAADVLKTMEEEAIKKNKKKQLPWMKVSGAGKSQIISNLFGGNSPEEMKDYLGQKNETKSGEKLTAQELIAKYSK